MTKRKLTKYEDDVRRNLRKSAEINPAQSPHNGIHTCSKGCKKQGCNRGLRDTIEEQNAQIESLKQDLLEKTAAVRQVAQDNKTETEATRIENARLQAEVERLTSDLQMEKENKDRLVREWQKANNEVYGLQTQVAALIDDQTRLKAELTDCKVEADRLKAEVERLTFDPLTYLDDQGEWMPRHIHLAAVERLQAEVERLDTLCKQLRMVVLYNDEAAVKGVQS